LARIRKEDRRWKEVVEDIQRFMQQVKNEFEMYFMGILRRPPMEKHRQLKRMFHEVTQNPPVNTGTLYKIRVLRTRFNTLSLLWLRTAKQIEEGTYKGHRFMADKREAERARKRKNSKSSAEIREEIRALARGEKLPEPEAKEEPVAARTKVERKPIPSPSRGHAADSQDLIREYLSHRRQNGEPTSIDQAALRRKLEQTREAIKQRYKVRDVRFKVVTENGRSRVKALPIK
jgi:hypothetical protein